MTTRPMWNHWSKQDKIDIERMALNIEPSCAKCKAPLPKHHDLDQFECRSCREGKAEADDE